MPTPPMNYERLSASTLGPLAECGLYGFLRNRAGVRPHTEGHVFGTAVHAALAFVYGGPGPNRALDGAPDIQRIHEIVDLWHTDDDRKMAVQAIDVVTRYREWESRNAGGMAVDLRPWVIAVEVDGQTDYGFSAQVDLLVDARAFRCGEGAIVVEHKSTRGYGSEAIVSRYASGGQVVGQSALNLGTPVRGVLVNLIPEKVRKTDPVMALRRLVRPTPHRQQQHRVAVEYLARTAQAAPAPTGMFTGACYRYGPCPYLGICESGIVDEALYQVVEPDALRECGLEHRARSKRVPTLRLAR